MMDKCKKCEKPVESWVSPEGGRDWGYHKCMPTEKWQLEQLRKKAKKLGYVVVRPEDKRPHDVWDLD